jgi:hypothetical protein
MTAGCAPHSTTYKPLRSEERWLAKYNDVKGFIEKNKRNPSKYDDYNNKPTATSEKRQLPHQKSANCHINFG